MSTENKIIEFIEKKFFSDGSQKIDSESPLLDSGAIDSMGIFDLVGFLESEFAIQVDDEEIVPEHFENVKSIAVFIESKNSS